MGDDRGFNETISSINMALEELNANKTLQNGIAVASAVLSLITSEALEEPDFMIDSKLIQLPNAERQDHWFHQHPWMRGQRATFELLDSDTSPIQAKFYWLQKKSTALIAGSVHFTKNWEDHDFTRTEGFKVGIDFFLLPDSSAVLVVLSNYGKLRVLELGGRLTNTQLEIFHKWHAFTDTEEQATLHSSLWESLKLQSVNTSFYAGVADAFNDLVVHLTAQGRDGEKSKLFASRLLGRLIFIWFLRKMGMISSDFNYFAPDLNEQGVYYRTSLERLFFRTLNTPVGDRDDEGSGVTDVSTPYLNGGLFAPLIDDWVGDQTLSFPKNFFQNLFDHFEQYNFTTDESTPEYEQVAIDPEMLGRVFESLLASQVEATGEQARKAKGAFYTPREVVSYMCKEGIRSHLENSIQDDARSARAIQKLIDTNDQDWAIAGTNSVREISSEQRTQILQSLRTMRTFDPACGSGAFPLALLQLLSKMHLRLDPSLDPYSVKLSILQNNIFGVDIEPMAVEISKLRSWLSLIVEEKDSKAAEPLPNLEFNFVCANSLISLESSHLLSNPSLQESLRKLRREYFGTSNKNSKQNIQKNYFKLTSPDLFDDFDERAKQLKTFNPFDPHVVAEFFDPEEMFGVSGGFDVIVGNPPYIGEKGHLDTFEPVKKSSLGMRFYQGKMDYFYFFFHLALNLLKHGGTVAFITTNYFITASSATNLIEDIQRRGTVAKMINFNELKLFESAAGQHNMISIIVKGNHNKQTQTTVVSPTIKGRASPEMLQAVFLGKPDVSSSFQLSMAELVHKGQMRLTNSSDNLIEQALNRIQAESVELKEHFRVSQGILTSIDAISQSHINKFGLDQSQLGSGVFVLSDKEVDSLALEDHELQIVKPWFKSSDIDRYFVKTSPNNFLIFGDKREKSLETRPKIQKHLDRYKTLIDKASSNSPYLHRPRSINFDSPKIVVPYKTPTTRFAISYGPWYASADVYFIAPKSGKVSLEALVGILNSKLMLCWLASRGKRKGGMLELYQEPLAAIPLPAWILEESRLLGTIEELAIRIQEERESDQLADISAYESKIDQAVYSLYRLEADARKAIEDWHFLQ